MTMQVTSAGLTCARLQVFALWRESWFISSLSYPNVNFTQHTVLCTEVTFHDDLVAVRTSHARTRMSRSHAQPWQRGISQLLGVKTTGITQCKQADMSHMPSDWYILPPQHEAIQNMKPYKHEAIPNKAIRCAQNVNNIQYFACALQYKFWYSYIITTSAQHYIYMVAYIHISPY